MEPIQDPTPYAGDGWLNLQKDGPQEQRGARFFGGHTLPATNSPPTENQWLDCFREKRGDVSIRECISHEMLGSGRFDFFMSP